MTARTKSRVATVITICVVLFPSLVLACSIPVFRYALERWLPDRYEIVVFSRGDLDSEHQRQMTELTKEGVSGEPVANVSIRHVDLDEENEPSILELWEAQTEPTLPWMAVYFPPRAPVQAALWSGPLSDESVVSLLNSPIRRQIAERLLNEDAVVWVLLEGGDKTRDDKAFQTLESRLDVLENTLKLPEIEASDLQSLSVHPDELKVSFSAIRVSRDDAQEKLLVSMLTGVEDDLRDEKYQNEPMAFPVFGRGRALYALVSDGIDDEMIHLACEFLTGSCSCTVKEQNPGVDILLTVDWDSGIVPQFSDDKPIPELIGLGAFAEPSDEVEPTDENMELALVDEVPQEPLAEQSASDPVAGVDSQPVVALTPTERIEPSGSFTFGLMLTGALAVASVFLVSLVLFMRKS